MDATAAREQLGEALDLVGRLASGEERWTMQVPARPDRDTDLVLTDALQLGERLALRVLELEAELVDRDTTIRQALETLGLPTDFWTNGRSTEPV